MRMKSGVLLVVFLAMLLAVAALAGSPTDKQCGKISAGQAVRPLPAQAKTVPAPRKSFGFPQVCSNPAKPGGGDDGLRPKAAPAPAPKAVSATVLWDQPVSTVNQYAYANQDFDTPYDGYDIYIADDFTNEVSWSIGTIFVPGDGWNGFTTLMNATSLTWAIYADQGAAPPAGPISMMGIPDGYPGGGNAPYWTITLPPTDPQVAITTGTGGYPSDATLSLTSPINLPAGHWWLVYYPTLSFTAGAGQFGRQRADTANGDPAQVINPLGGFGFPTSWTPVTSESTWTLDTQDFAFRLEDAGCAETVQDGSFEAGSPNPYWAEYSTNFGTPLCDPAGCGTGGGTAGPHTGSWWSWFGGTSSAEAGSVEQTVTIPNGTAALTFWAWCGVVGVSTDYTRVLMDGNQIWRANGDSASYPAYTQVTVDVSSYADGGAHLLRIESDKSGGHSYNFNIDDISLVSCVNPCSTIYVYPYTLPTPTVGVPYTLQFWAYGGTDPYTFAVTAGTLPPGLTLATDGTLSGTLTALGDFSFTVTATDANGCTGEQSYSMATWSAYFLDDQGRSKLCVNRLTGDYIWEITTGPGMGTYTGVANIINGGTKIYSKPGADDYLNCTYDAIKKRAAGYYITAAGDYSALKDYNTTNNVGGCFGGEQNPE